jgi:hypothetical protein
MTIEQLNELERVPGIRRSLTIAGHEFSRRSDLPRGHRWGCNVRGRGVMFCRTPLEAFVLLRRWRRLGDWRP